MLNISDDVVAPQLHHYHHRISLPARNGGRISHVLVVAFPAVTTHAQVHGLCHHVISSHSGHLLYSVTSWTWVMFFCSSAVATS